MPEPERIPIRCDCHGTEVMGYMVGDKLVWFDRRHGQNHVKVLTEIKSATMMETVQGKKP